LCTLGFLISGEGDGVRMLGKWGLGVAGLLLAGCGGGDNSQELSVADKLFKLGHMNGCIECHRISATVVGPSWDAINERYKDEDAANLKAMLIQSVTYGSQGKWHTWKGGAGMPAMEKRVSKEHIEQLVDYIIALRPAKTATTDAAQVKE